MSDQNVKAAQKYLNAMFGGHKAWVRKDSISLILSCMYGCSHNLSASESLKIPPDSKVLIL